MTRMKSRAASSASSSTDSGLTPVRTDFLRGLFPGDALLTAPEELAPFGTDASRLAAMPWAVVRPESAEQVRELLRWADAERVPIIPRARGTNRVGSAVPRGGGVVVSMLRMNRILEIDPRDFTAVVEPGVITGDLQAAARAEKLFYPPDPSSARISTVGGNVSTCAGGLRAVKYGVTRDYVLGMDAVLPGGELLRLGGRSHKDVVGLDLVRLFVGSVGCLGLMTRIILKLLPLPAASASLLAGYDSLHAALEGAQAVFRAGILPTAMEFMDRNTMRALTEEFRERGGVPWPDGTEAALLLKIDGSAEGLAVDLEMLRGVVGGTRPKFLQAGTGDAEERLWEVRRAVSPAAFRLRPDKMGEDIAVPRGRTTDAVERIHALAAERDLCILCFGHLGDGNIHVSIMHDAEDAAETARAHAAKEIVFRIALELGGTISGEHGIGLAKKAFVPFQLGEAERAVMARVKAAFDPHGIMNPGREPW